MTASINKRTLSSSRLASSRETDFSGESDRHFFEKIGNDEGVNGRRKQGKNDDKKSHFVLEFGIDEKDPSFINRHVLGSYYIWLIS